MHGDIAMESGQDKVYLCMGAGAGWGKSNGSAGQGASQAHGACIRNGDLDLTALVLLGDAAMSLSHAIGQRVGIDHRTLLIASTLYC